ncbi:MAG: hypothetical protein ACRD3D_06335 [Terriglobia bacterium]
MAVIVWAASLRDKDSATVKVMKTRRLICAPFCLESSLVIKTHA